MLTLVTDNLIIICKLAIDGNVTCICHDNRIIILFISGVMIS